MYEPLIAYERDTHNRCFRGRLWCISDICGIICAVMTWLLVLYADIVIFIVVYGTTSKPYYSSFNSFLFNALAFLALTSHSKAMFTDPVSTLVNIT